VKTLPNAELVEVVLQDYGYIRGSSRNAIDFLVVKFVNFILPKKYYTLKPGILGMITRIDQTRRNAMAQIQCIVKKKDTIAIT
jgi:hypothetical protein